MMALDSFVQARQNNRKIYAELFRNIDGITVQNNPSADYESNFWLTCILIDSKKFGRASEEIRLELESENIETRPLWKPMHIQPLYSNVPYYGNGVSENLFKNGLCLPSGVGLTRADIERIVKIILRGYQAERINRFISFSKVAGMMQKVLQK
jgi:dTDP-4-amino-4,6-dideoxygalactose transaminase